MQGLPLVIEVELRSSLIVHESYRRALTDLVSLKSKKPIICAVQDARMDWTCGVSLVGQTRKHVKLSAAHLDELLVM